MIRYILSQQVLLGYNSPEWFDLDTNANLQPLIDYGKKILAKHPTVVLAIRKVEETILENMFDTP